MKVIRKYFQIQNIMNKAQVEMRGLDLSPQLQYKINELEEKEKLSEEDLKQINSLLPEMDKKLSDKLHRLHVYLARYWRHNGGPFATFRSFSYALYTLRSSHDIPLLIFVSAKDNDFAVVTFRDNEPSSSGFLARLPSLRGKKFRDWPSVDFPTNMDAPETLCERPQCNASAGPSNHPQFVHHAGPRDVERRTRVKARCRAAWASTWNEKAQKQIEHALGEIAQASEEERGQARMEIYNRVSAEMEEQIEREVRSEIEAKLLKCTRCKLAAYCSRECQAQDWSRHKLVCREAK